MKKISHKIPGHLLPPPKSEIDGKISDLSSKNIPELLELRDRQEKLLNNKTFLGKLADKGDKIKSLHKKIVLELEAKQKESDVCYMVENMKLTGIDSQSLQDVEWEGKVKAQVETYLDSDDDSEPEDALHILSQSTVVEKIIKVLPPEKPSVTPEDLLKIGDNPHIKYLVNITENNPSPATPHNLFKPYKTTKTDVHNPNKEMCTKKGKHWEVTAATPPPIIHGPAKILTIEESLKLQKDYNIHLKDVEAKHAAEKLLAKLNIKMSEFPIDSDSFKGYRDTQSRSDSEDNNSEEEVLDEEPDRGGVVFTVMK